MVYFTYVDKDSLTILCIIPEIKLFSTTFLCGRALISTPGLTLLMSILSSIFVVFVLVGSNIVEQPVTDLRPESETVMSVFLKMQGTVPGIDKALELFVSLFTEHDPLSSTSVVLSKKQNT